MNRSRCHCWFYSSVNQCSGYTKKSYFNRSLVVTPFSIRDFEQWTHMCLGLSHYHICTVCVCRRLLPHTIHTYKMNECSTRSEAKHPQSSQHSRFSTSYSASILEFGSWIVLNENESWDVLCMNTPCKERPNQNALTYFSHSHTISIYFKKEIWIFKTHKTRLSTVWLICRIRSSFSAAAFNSLQCHELHINIMSINILTERLYVICLEHWLLIVLFGLEILIFSPDGVPSSTKYKILGSMTRRKHMYVSENEHKHASTPFWLK